MISQIFNSSANVSSDPSDRCSKMMPIKCPRLETKITINPRTQDPDTAFSLCNLIKNEVEPLKLDEPMYPNKVYL